EARDWQPVWRRSVERGAPGTPLSVGPWLLVGESEGALLLLELGTGRERGRLDGGLGFLAQPAFARGRGFVLGNSGSLRAFEIVRGGSSS
ncbi:MAG: hypothetical protein NZ898_10260, partial [Myxococcota bacterium]|nr:hypothetical protein [Myxococcota bacterium]